MSGIFGAGQLQFLGGEDAFYGFEITNSLRFDGNAYLTRTLGSAGNRKTYTLSVWVKRWKSESGFLYCSGHSDLNNFGGPEFFTDQVGFQNYNNGTQVVVQSTELFRDPAAWSNFVWAVDTTQGTLADRLKVYVNGSQLSGLVMSDSDFTQNYEGHINTNGQVHNIGARFPRPEGGLGHFYLAEYNFIDGTALTPSSFGETKEGIWIPKDTSGLTFGTQGFRLQFKNSSVGSASSSTVGADTSGNNHHFSSINIATTDNMTDSPTDNFCTMNPLSNGDATYSDGNLKVDTNLANGIFAQGTIAIPKTGKWYFEASVQDNSNAIFGIAESNNPFGSGFKYIAYNFAGQKEVDGAAAASYGDAYANGDFVAIGINADDNEVTFFKNGVSQGAISYTMDSTKDYLADLRDGSGGTRAIFTFNFGQQPFTYTPPTGFVALSTANLPDPAIDPAQGENPTEYFNILTWTGNTATSRAFTGVGFQPDWLWSKSRSATRSHPFFDSVRGVTKYIVPDSTAAELPSPSSGFLSSFDADGFTATQGSSNFANLNNNSESYVGWLWKAGGSAVSNTDGSITSTVSASTKAGFSIVSWTGNSSTATSTIGHGLSKALDWLLIKNRDSGTSNWIVWHSGFSNLNRNLYLNGTGGENTNGPFFLGDDSTVTIPTSTVFTVADNSQVNETSAEIIAYCFHSVDQYSKFGNYEGNHTNGVTVFCGFKPSLVIVKNIDATSDWEMYDATRDSNGSERLEPNTSDPEPGSGGSGAHLRFSSTGFTLPAGTQRTNTNETGNTYIFIAFAAQPFKFANAQG